MVGENREALTLREASYPSIQVPDRVGSESFCITKTYHSLALTSFYTSESAVDVFNRHALDPALHNNTRVKTNCSVLFLAREP